MTKDLIILHNNDLHNSLYFRIGKDFEMYGGISMMSDYIQTVRAENKNVLYTISGDILQEDISGSDYKGINTLSIINEIAPDAVSLGNHELDYGLAHLLIFKECLSVPVLNANIEVGSLNKNLFIPSMILKAGEIRILAIGVIPQAFFKKILSDKFCDTMLTYRDTYEAIRDEIKKYSPEDYDLTVLLSHYGLEGDVRLAEEMPEDIKIDLILGGHDHIDMDEAKVVNGIPIAQSSYGTTHVGRFDIKYDTDKRCISEWKWLRVEISSKNCKFNETLDNLADNSFANRKKREKILVCRFAKEYTQKNRLYESELGDIVSDAFLNIYHPDFVILQSGSLRKPVCPTEMTETDLHELYPFDDSFCIAKISGGTIKKMFEYLFLIKLDGSMMSGTFQYSDGFSLIVDGTDYEKKGRFTIEQMTLNGQPFEDSRIYRVGVTKNCLTSFKKYFNSEIPSEAVRTVSISTYSDLATYLLSFDTPVEAPELGHRFVFKNFVLK